MLVEYIKSLILNRQDFSIEFEKPELWNEVNRIWKHETVVRRSDPHPDLVVFHRLKFGKTIDRVDFHTFGERKIDFFDKLLPFEYFVFMYSGSEKLAKIDFLPALRIVKVEFK